MSKCDFHNQRKRKVKKMSKIQDRLKVCEENFNKIKDKLIEIEENQKKLATARTTVVEELVRLQGEHRVLEELLKDGTDAKSVEGAVTDGKPEGQRVLEAALSSGAGVKSN